MIPKSKELKCNFYFILFVLKCRPQSVIMTILTMEIEACLVFSLLLESDSQDKLTLFRKDGALVRSLTYLPACMWDTCNLASLPFATTAAGLEWQESFLQTFTDLWIFFFLLRKSMFKCVCKDVCSMCLSPGNYCCSFRKTQKECELRTLFKEP